MSASVRFSELVEAQPVRLDIDGVPVCVVRLGDHVRAVHDTCSHQQWSLAEGMVHDGGVECSLHGSTFDLATGRPSSLPALKPIPTFEVRIEGDEVHVDVSTATNDAPFPEH